MVVIDTAAEGRDGYETDVYGSHPIGWIAKAMADAVLEVNKDSIVRFAGYLLSTKFIQADAMMRQSELRSHN